MGELVYSRHHGEGLIIAEYAADERAVSAALKDFDRTLRLVWEQDGRTGRPVWNVVAVWSQDHPAQQVLTWREGGSGDPLPLSMRLVDEVKRIRQVDTVRVMDAANARIRAEADRQTFNDTLDVVTEFETLARKGRSHVPHTVGNARLAAAKRRGRDSGRAQ